MVTIAFTSDLHVDSSAAGAADGVARLARAVEEAEPDLFVLAGDVGGGATGLLGTLEALRPLPVPKLFVPGNHDLWMESAGSLARYRLDSATKYHRLLPALCEAAGWHYLPKEPFRIDGLGLAGVMGWYDYSLRNRSLDGLIPREAYRRGRFGRLVWNDARRIRWPREPGKAGWRRRAACLEDEAILEVQVEELEGHLGALEREGASGIVVATHFLPGPEPIQYTGLPKVDFAYGFAGSERLGALLASRPSVRALICGHTHQAFRGHSRNLPVFKNPAGRLDKPRPPRPGGPAGPKVGLLTVEGEGLEVRPA